MKEWWITRVAMVEEMKMNKIDLRKVGKVEHEVYPRDEAMHVGMS